MSLQIAASPSTEKTRTLANIEPAELAESVRKLALDAHQVLKSEAATRKELMDLALRIALLRKRMNASHHRGVDRWLERAAELIEERQAASRSLGLHMHIHA
jgi:hypothetical protein